MADFKGRLFGLNLSTSKTPLQDLLLELGNEPYRSFVEYRIKDLSAKELQDAAIDSWWEVLDALGLPHNLEVGAKVSAVLRSRILVDPTYWQGSQARSYSEALADIYSIIDAEMDLPSEWLQPVETLTEQHQRSVLALVFFVTDLFAGHGAESKLIRSNMGIKKGLFG